MVVWYDLLLQKAKQWRLRQHTVSVSVLTPRLMMNKTHRANFAECEHEGMGAVVEVHDNASGGEEHKDVGRLWYRGLQNGLQ